MHPDLTGRYLAHTAEEFVEGNVDRSVDVALGVLVALADVEHGDVLLA